MELPIIPFVCNVRFQDIADPSCDSAVGLIAVWSPHGNVVDGDANEGVACVWATTDIDVVDGEFDEVHDHVEGWEADVGVHLCDVAGEGLLGGVVLERAGGVVDDPERHFDVPFCGLMLLGLSSRLDVVTFVTQIRDR